MEDRSLNGNTPSLETKETKTQRELFIVIDEITNTFEHFGKEKETLQHPHQTPAYNKKKSST